MPVSIVEIVTIIIGSFHVFTCSVFVCVMTGYVSFALKKYFLQKSFIFDRPRFHAPKHISKLPEPQK